MYVPAYSLLMSYHEHMNASVKYQNLIHYGKTEAVNFKNELKFQLTYFYCQILRSIDE